MATDSGTSKGLVIGVAVGVLTLAIAALWSSGLVGPIGFGHVALRIEGPHSGPVDQPIYLAAKAVRVSNVEDDVSSRTEWSSEDETVAIVSHGTIRPMRPGTTRIRAVFQGYPAELLLTIEPPRTLGLEVTGPSSLLVGEVGTLSLSLSQSGGVKRNVTADASWESSNSTVVAVAANGQLRAITSGNGVIHAAYEGKTTDWAISVREVTVTRVDLPRNIRTALGDLVTVPVKVRLSNGRVETIAEGVEWSVDNSNVIDMIAPGKFRSVGHGTAVITAKYRDQTGEVMVVVDSQPTAPPPPLPIDAVLDKGTTIGIRTSTELSTRGLPQNALVPAVLTGDITAESGLISRANSPAEVRVAAYRPPGRHEAPFLRLTLDSIQGPGGRKLSLKSDSVDLRRPSFLKGFFKGLVGGAAGAAAGAAIGGKKGAAMGASAGAAVATAYVLLDKGDHLVLNPGAVLIFRTIEPLRIIR